MRKLLQLAFQGTHYHGWQVQPDAISVQSVLEAKLSMLLHEKIELVGCGRTDAGVHAQKYFAHFDCRDTENHISLKSLNAVLPDDIAVHAQFEVPGEFHARYDAVKRKYIYKMNFYKDPFQLADSYYFRESASLQLDRLNECALVISKLNDFSSFVKSGSGLTEFKCIVTESCWLQTENDRLEYHISANRFVRGMVRLIVGMCINYATGKISLQQIQDDIFSKKQITKSLSISASGLSLVDVQYPPEKQNLWKSIDDFRV